MLQVIFWQENMYVYKYACIHVSSSIIYLYIIIIIIIFLSIIENVCIWQDEIIVEFGKEECNFFSFSQVQKQHISQL